MHSNFQHRFFANVLGGIIENILIFAFIHDNLTGKCYLEFLNNKLPDLLNNVPLNNLANIWYLNDGAPAHIHRSFREFVNEQFGED